MKLVKPKKVIVILGPTSSGKTNLAVKLAKQFNGEIISADSRQVYKGMDVGTGKDLGEYKIKKTTNQENKKTKIEKIPYHLIDVVSPKKQFTVADYQQLAYRAIDDILQRGKVPIICGGTGLYISAVTEGYILPKVQSSKFKIQSIRNKLNKLNLNQLLEQLKKIDQKTYRVIDKNNRRRVQRALEIYYQTGLSKSAQLEKRPPAYKFLVLSLSFSRKVLNQRIDSRLKHRLEKGGLVKEVKRLHQQGVSWKRLEEFGLEYRWVAKYLQGKISYDEMFKELKKAIHHFAKRQMTWFKRNKNIKWIQGFSSAQREIDQFLK